MPDSLEPTGTTAGTEEPILLCSDDLDHGIRTLTLNRPKARNALSMPLMQALLSAIEAAGSAPKIKVVILAANGPAFCAGHDLREIRERKDDAFYQALFGLCSQLMTAIVRLPKPVIAKVHAMATAAGCQLVASCDLALCAEDTRFATPGVNIGLFCSTPMVALSRNVGRKAAMEMLLTGHPVAAQEAQALGLVNRVVAAEALDEAVTSMAQTIAGKSPLTVAIGKEAFYRQLEMPLQDAYDYTAAVMARNMATHDAQEGIDAFLQKRTPIWKGE
ncbi:MAG: enoyl-CoA hydratase [Rhodospirillaceae bacterium]